MSNFKAGIVKLDNARQSLIDFLILSLLLGLNSFITIGRVSFSPSLSLTYNRSHDLILSLIITALNIILITFFFFRHKEPLKRNEMTVVSLFGVFAILKLFSIIKWNIDPSTYILPDCKGGEVNFDYSFMPIVDVITSFLMEIQFYGIFIFLFIALERVDKTYTTLYLQILFALIYLVIISMIIYSLVINYKEYIHNLYCIVNGKRNYYTGIQSYVLNRNAFGFFLMIGCAISHLYFSKFKNPAFYFSGLIMNFFTFIIFSKTPFFITSALSIGVSIAFALRNFKEHKISTIVILGWNILFYGYIGLAYFLFPTFYNSIIAPIVDTLTEPHTVNARYDLHVPSMYLFSYDPFSIMFGYSHYHYVNLFYQYSRFLPVDQFVHFTSHNSFIDVLTSNGVLGSTLILSFFAYFIGKDVLAYFKKDWVHAISLVAVWILFIIYSCMEPRMLFLMEGTSIFFILFLIDQKVDQEELFPIFKLQLIKNLKLA